MKTILFEVDKCVKCRACVVACKRNWDRNPSQSYLTGLKLAAYGNAEKIDTDNPITVKAQNYVDRTPYVRYSCWHCDEPPCAIHCPFQAVKKDPVTGAVYIKHLPAGAGDTEYCQPQRSECTRQCLHDCARGGYPRIDGHPGDGVNTKAYKCMMCYGRLLDGNELADASGNKKAGQVPACVLGCLADALQFGDSSVVNAYVAAKGYTWTFSSGNAIWASKNGFSAPTADPFVEDHISPVLDSLLKSPVGKAVLVPSLLVGGLYALYARRVAIANEAK